MQIKFNFQLLDVLKDLNESRNPRWCIVSRIIIYDV